MYTTRVSFGHPLAVAGVNLRQLTCCTNVNGSCLKYLDLVARLALASSYNRSSKSCTENHVHRLASTFDQGLSYNSSAFWVHR